MCEPKVPTECITNFAEINESLTKLLPIVGKVDLLTAAILGNGSPERGLLMRVLTLETAKKGLTRSWRSAIGWCVKVGTAIILLLIGMYIKGN